MQKKGYENRLKNISYIEARELVQKEVGSFTMKKVAGMAWTQKSEDIFFYDSSEKLVAIYGVVLKDFWFTKNGR